MRVAAPRPSTRYTGGRKTLRNALRAVWPEDLVDRALAATAIDGVRRGETLDIAEFGALAAALVA